MELVRTGCRGRVWLRAAEAGGLVRLGHLGFMIDETRSR
jgi:hypothetical protein